MALKNQILKTVKLKKYLRQPVDNLTKSRTKFVFNVKNPF